ncbi:hypothetical protein Tco_0674177 [Tanacetum coccineum]
MHMEDVLKNKARLVAKDIVGSDGRENAFSMAMNEVFYVGVQNRRICRSEHSHRWVPFRKLLGRKQLTCCASRPDLVFAVSYVSHVSGAKLLGNGTYCYKADLFISKGTITWVVYRRTRLFELQAFAECDMRMSWNTEDDAVLKSFWMRSQLRDLMDLRSTKFDVERKVVELYFVGEKYQLVDIFTYGFTRERFATLLPLLGLNNCHQRLEGSTDESTVTGLNRDFSVKRSTCSCSIAEKWTRPSVTSSDRLRIIPVGCSLKVISYGHAEERDVFVPPGLFVFDAQPLRYLLYYEVKRWKRLVRTEKLGNPILRYSILTVSLILTESEVK